MVGDDVPGPDEGLLPGLAGPAELPAGEGDQQEEHDDDGQNQQEDQIDAGGGAHLPTGCRPRR